MSKAMHSPSIIAFSFTIDDCAGLTWAPEGFFEEMQPQWKFEPSIDAITTIARRELAIGENSKYTVEFLAKGTSNKVYVIHCEDKNDYIMRVSLPVQPRLKTLSEHATSKYIRQNTSLPVPQVIASDARNNNELRFEWMITQRIPGDNLREQWRHMSWMKKELLVRKVIDYQMQLFRKRFHHIGNIYDTTSLQALSTASVPVTVPLGTDHSSESVQHCLSQIVSIPFFYHEHWKLDIPRGPYPHVFRDERDEKDYWRRVEEHEKTQLREFYVEEMQRVCPEWIQVHEAGAMKADFDFAVNTVSLGATVAFEMWLKRVEQDQEPLAFRNSMSQS